MGIADAGRPVGEVVRGLLLLYDVLDVENMAGAVEYV